MASGLLADLLVMPLRPALCGHPYDAPFTRGRARKLCDNCSQPEARTCRACNLPVVGRRRDAVFCSAFCSDVCRGERLPEALPARTCALEECDVVFQPYRRGQRCCSERHGKLLYNRESRADGRQSSPGWTDKRRDDWHRRRAVQVGASTGRPVIRDEIAARDGYICGICGDHVDMAVLWPSPLSPSLDHIHPLQPSDGSEPGLHDPDNVQLAHLGCNVRKSNSILPS